MEKECLCESSPTLIFACSGAADVGKIADEAARLLTREGAGRMFCLAGIGGRVSGIMESTKAATRIMALDGCPLDCVRECLVQAGFQDFIHLRVTGMGLSKGKAPVSSGNIETVAGHCRNVLLKEA
jgi:uncharacterized metal-binding protein